MGHEHKRASNTNRWGTIGAGVLLLAISVNPAEHLFKKLIPSPTEAVDEGSYTSSLFNETPEEGSVRLMSLGVPHALPLTSKEELKVLMSDPNIQQNWGLMGTGGASDIKAQRAWEITQGSRDIVVAIIDTGADTRHPDLKKNLWTNPGETGLDAKGRDKATNGEDDDKNGFKDDVHGWNFVSDDNKVTDNHGHGTHVAGIVGAEGGNGIGISGVAPRVSLMVLKYYDPSSKGNDNLRNTIRAMRYAIQNKANIINYSGGGLEYSNEEYAAVKAAKEAGILFIAAAGNERSNSDMSHYYPADYPLDNIISVTAINPKAEVLATSNYGVQTVHIAAPGEGIFSTLPNNRYGVMTGTSQATAFVTGVAALIMSNNSEFKFPQIKKQILATADEIPNLRSKTKTSGKLNSWAALAIQPSIPVTGIVTATQGTPEVFSNSAENGPASGSAAQLRATLNSLMESARQPAQRANN